MGDIYDSLTNTQLIEAVRNGEAARVKEMIESGSDIDEPGEQGWTPLNWAAGKGNLEMVTLLVQNGANVFKTGRDQRTPYMIALAAGHAEVVKFLRQAEDSSTAAEKPERQVRIYCKAYHLKELRQFKDWTENRINWKAATDADDTTGEAEFTDDSIVFLHQDYIVTESIWANENVIFNNVTPEWRDFCTSVLGFAVPDDLDLIVAAGAESGMVNATTVA